MTAIKAEDILSTLQGLELIQYRKGQHVICADPKVLDRHLKAAGRGGLDVDVSKLIWTPYKEQNWACVYYFMFYVYTEVVLHGMHWSLAVDVGPRC